MSIKSIVRTTYKKASLKMLLPSVYKKHAKKAANPKKAVFIEVRSAQLSDNFALINEALTKQGFTISLHCLRLGFVGFTKYLKNCLAMVKDIADARYVFLNERSNVYGCLPIRKETVTVQTWHACGAFKRFGLSTGDVAFGEAKEDSLNYPPYGNLDYITVSSPEVIWAYEEAMNIKPDSGQQVVAIGTSRTDMYFDKKRLASARDNLLSVVPTTDGKRIILYAPTFRGNSTSGARIPNALDIARLKESLPEDTILLIKHHPLAKDTQIIPDNCRDFAFDITRTLSIEDALMTADLCISDYSSLVFEYSLMDKPMVFFAYDMQEYIDDRGFYYPFEEFCPGPIAKDMDQLIAAIDEAQHSGLEKIRAFREKFMSSCDGHATERLLELISTAKPL